MDQLIAFLHGALGLSALFTLCDALDKGYLTSLPDISAKLIRKHPTTYAAMIQGHLYQIRRNTGSTISPSLDLPPTQLATSVHV